MKKLSFEKIITRLIVIILFFFLVNAGYAFAVHKTHSNDNLPNRIEYLELANSYEKVLGWKVSYINWDGGIFTWNDGNLVVYDRKWDVTPAIDLISFVKSDLESQGIDLLYVQAPNKISRLYDTDISGKLDFSNQNIDDLLTGLRGNGIDCIDIRDNIEGEGLDQHFLYYRTDNHWKAETGLWVSGIVGDYLKENYPYEIDTSVLDPALYNYETLENWWIGAAGKKLTLAKTEPEDFTLIYPDFETDLTISVPYKNVEKTGDFSVTYNNSLVFPKDFYNKYTYLAYGYGCQPLITIKNNNATNDTHILVLKDSFADSVYPFLALSVAQVDIIDPRYFFFDDDVDITIQEYVKNADPDIVIMLYSPLISYFPDSLNFDITRSEWEK